MFLQGSLSIERMCQLVPVSRRSFYRSLKERRPVEEETEVRSVIQQIALEHHRRYGYRRITAELRRRGMQVNHKRVVRIMQEDNLLALQPKRFKLTTNSNHKFEVYLNLAARMKLTGINQLWVADITYIRLKAEFVYLAVILDGFSRKVVGWALDRTLAVHTTTWNICGRTSKSSSRSITIGSGCTPLWVIDLRKNSSNRPKARPNLEAQRWCFLRTRMRTDNESRQHLWGRGRRRPLPQTPSPARRYENAFMKAETVSKEFVPS